MDSIGSDPDWSPCKAFGQLGSFIAGFFFNPVWSYPGAFEPFPLLVLLLSSLVSTALGALWWNIGIQRVGAATASLFLNGQPVVGIFAAAVFLGENLFWVHYVALGLVILGVSLGTGMIGKSASN